MVGSWGDEEEDVPGNRGDGRRVNKWWDRFDKRLARFVGFDDNVCRTAHQPSILDYLLSTLTQGDIPS